MVRKEGNVADNWPTRLADAHGRVGTDLRISVTDRCNLRCVYCLPADAATWTRRDDLLTPEEFTRLARIGIELGIRDIRLSGGEPLLRPDLAQIVAGCSEAFEAAGLTPHVALTTNAIGLASAIPALTDAGLERINLSVDTLESSRFADLTRRSRFDDLLAGLDAVAASPLDPVKVNTVIVDETSLAEIGALVRFCLARGWQWRAIEWMPIGPMPHDHSAPTGEDIFAELSRHFTLTPRTQDDPHAPATTWDIAKGEDHPAGIVGIIASMSAPFCDRCTRTRLSADGRMYPCLFSRTHVDLKHLLRSGASDAAIARAWADGQAAKPRGHRWLPEVPQAYSLSQIGG